MSRLLRCLLLVWLALLLGAGAAPGIEGKPRPPDPSGAPLRPGAVPRIGTLRLPHAGPLIPAAYPPHGQTSHPTGNDGLLRLADQATGNDVSRCAGLDAAVVSGE